MQSGPALGEAAGGQWRQKAQLVWDASSRQLVRKTFRVWDGEPQRDLDFYWEPDGDQLAHAGEVIEGRGTLTWRRRGAPNYDRKSIYSTYHGELADGRPHGAGRIELHTGANYEGTWVAGLMHGRGSLRLESGEVYVGDFRHGQIHGQGRQETISGEIYEGAFVDGERHGAGLLISATRAPRAATWVFGREVYEEGQTRLVQLKPAGSGDMTISVATDSRRNKQMRDASAEGEPVLTYVHQARPGEVAILPDDKRFMSMWKQGGQIYNLEEHVSGDYSQGNYRSPAFLKVTISRGTTPGLSVKALTLAVAESRSDMQPFLGVQGSLSGGQIDCDSGGAVPYNPIINFVNTGWGAPVNAKATISFSAKGATPASQPLDQQIGTFDRLKRLSVERELQILGVDSGQLKSWNYKCGAVEQLKSCQQQVLSQLRLGQLKPHATFLDGGRYLVTYVSGTLSYQWKDHVGAMQSSRAPFKTRILLGAIQVKIPAECGAGGPDLPNAGVPILELIADRTNYQLSYPLKSPAALGDKGRDIILGLFAKKSSNHRLRVVAELSDGRKISSLPVAVTYARPRGPPAYDELRPELKGR